MSQISFRLDEPEGGRGHGEDVDECCEFPDVGSCLPREAVEKPIRSPIDDLTQRGVRCVRWPWERSSGGVDDRVKTRFVSGLFLHADVGYNRDRSKVSFYSSLAMGY